MSIAYAGINGEPYVADDEPLGKGGEGTVYKILGKPDLVVKEFNENIRTETRHRKLLAMAQANLSGNMLKQLCWPIDVVYLNKNFVGYVMPKLENFIELNVMYLDDSGYNLEERLMVAKNLCAAINAVHNSGQVCGDLNPKNIVVNPETSRVTLVDTDSYHITDARSGKIYRCEVGLPEYLAAEIQEKMMNNYNLINAPLPTFTKETDLFALAIHIFALLMNGCHPFASAVDYSAALSVMSMSRSSVAAPQPIDNIRGGHFIFYKETGGLVKPKYAPDFNILPDYIQELFVRTFVDGHNDPTRRADTLEWYDALSKMQDELSVCPDHEDHMYWSHLKECPWCALQRKLQEYVAPVTPVDSRYAAVIEASRKGYSGPTADELFAREKEELEKALNTTWYQQIGNKVGDVLYDFSFAKDKVVDIATKTKKAISNGRKDEAYGSEPVSDRYEKDPYSSFYPVSDGKVDDNSEAAKKAAAEFKKTNDDIRIESYRNERINVRAEAKKEAWEREKVHTERTDIYALRDEKRSSSDRKLEQKIYEEELKEEIQKEKEGKRRAQEIRKRYIASKKRQYKKKGIAGVIQSMALALHEILEALQRKGIYIKLVLLCSVLIQIGLRMLDEEKHFNTIAFSICGVVGAGIYIFKKLWTNTVRFKLMDYVYAFLYSVIGRYVGTFIIISFFGDMIK